MAESSFNALSKNIGSLEEQAHSLAERLPELLVEAKRVAHTITHGIHGRRRRGPGETFWQFRPYEQSDTVSEIDWRRSASSDTLYIREREWEAAHTIWLWPDLSRSMGFGSHLSQVTKVDRSLVLMLALSELLVLAGERVGIVGYMTPTASRMAMAKLAESVLQMVADGSNLQSLPPDTVFSPFSEFVTFGDFLDQPEELTQGFKQIASQGVRGHLVQVFDPAEETLPYSGRTLFEAREGSHSLLTGRAETLRDGYTLKLAEHRSKLQDLTQNMEWSFLLHHTDRPAGEALLALYTKLTGQESHYQTARPTVEDSGKGLDRNSLLGGRT